MKFNWKTISVLTSGSRLCQYGGSYIREEVRKHDDIEIVEYTLLSEIMSSGFEFSSDFELKRWLKNFKERSRGDLCIAL